MSCDGSVSLGECRDVLVALCKILTHLKIKLISSIHFKFCLYSYNTSLQFITMERYGMTIDYLRTDKFYYCLIYYLFVTSHLVYVYYHVY